MAKILIVDDEKSIRRTLGEFLLADAHEVVEAEDADTALLRLQETEFDLVVTDIVLPRVTGVELLRRIQATAPHIQVVMMTGEPTIETATEALRMGATDYLFKPITKVAILRVVANAVRLKTLEDTQRRLEAENRAHQANLERLVEERTAGLTAANKSLAASRGLAFTLLDRTAAAKEQAEQTAAKLQREVTERQQAETSLRASEARFRAVTASATDAIISTDSAGNIVGWNGGAERIFGYTEAEVSGQPLTLLIPSRHQDGHLAGLARMQAGGARHVMGKTVEVGGRHQDGHEFPLELSLAEWQVAEGRFYTAIIRDITERKQAEAERAKLEGQFHQAQKLELVGRLAGGVAHDFNNMLGVILGYVELALVQVAPAQPLFADLEQIRKAARRSADLTRQLLTFARREVIVPQVLDLNAAMEDLLKMLRRLIGEDINLAWLPATGLGQVKVDPTQIHQILANLCVNARDAISRPAPPSAAPPPAGWVGKITIATGNAAFDETYCGEHPGFVPGEYVLLTVSDNGCGMDPETLAHIFEPFYTTKGIGEGTGLGLATVYGIVQQNHGFIQVDSTPGQGTTFNIYLPRHASQGSAPQPETAGEPRLGAGETVLLVEDEPVMLDIARRVLERLGYTVLPARTPTEALRLAGAPGREIHLLLADVVLPEMNGWELSRRLVSLHPKLKCLFMSGYTANDIALHGVLNQELHFIPKPFSVNDLAAKVREVLER